MAELQPHEAQRVASARRHALRDLSATSFSAIKPSLSGERIVATYGSSRSPATLRHAPAGEPVAWLSLEVVVRIMSMNPGGSSSRRVSS